MNVNAIKFPVIVMSKDGSVYATDGRDRLTASSVTAFRKGFFNNQKIYDSLGKQYTVANAVRVKRLPLYWGWKGILTMPSMVRVELELEEEGEFDFDKVKSRFMKAIKTGHGLDSAVGGEHLRVKLERAMSFSEFVSALRECGFSF
jgi:hypothetical protein